MRKTAIITLLAIVLITGSSFKNSFDETDWLNWTNNCLNKTYNPASDRKLKKWNLTVTSDSFIRLRKYYVKNKQVYYSFKLDKLSDVKYRGNAKKGTLELKTKEDDIMMQTYNNRRGGDIDEMKTVLDIPVKNMKAARLDSLKEALNYLKEKAL
jgi:hypothetical protein